jgi:hypothetical protein
MPSELEDVSGISPPPSYFSLTTRQLVEFLHHGNTQIRQVAAEHLVGYSTAQPAIFKSSQLAPVNDLKLLVKDYSVSCTR